MASKIAGPIEYVTLVTNDFDSTFAQWHDQSNQSFVATYELSEEESSFLGYDAFVGCRCHWVANPFGEVWLRILDVPFARARLPFTEYGWAAIEVNVVDVHDLYARLDTSLFKVIGKPKNLAISDKICAMQCIGTANEVIYFTEIQENVPGFELPFARSPVDRVFIMVASVPDIDTATTRYSDMTGTEAVQFKTRISAMSSVLGRPLDSQYSVATLQLAEKNLIELDQVEGMKSASTEEYPPTGILSVALRDAPLHRHGKRKISRGPYAGRHLGVIRGPTGELIEFIS